MHLPTQIELRSVRALLPHARNSRTHSDEQVSQVAASIREFGWTNPILVDGDGVVIAGHARLLAARKLGMEEVPVIVLAHLTPAQKRALVIADNKLALNAGWDEDMLRSEVAALQEDGFDLDLVGFSDEELRILLADHALGEDDATGADEIPETPVNPVSRPGDVWVIGRHRLICADCRDAATVARLLDGARVTLPFTGSRLPEINDLWNLAASDEHVADLLRLPFADRAAGRLLMLHREELFPTIRFPQQKGFDHITAQYIPWLSQTLQKTSRRTQKLFLNPVTHSRYQRAHAAFDQFNAIIQDSARDRFALAGLKFIKNSPGFMRILEDGKPIDYGVLKSTLRNYEDVDASESIAELLEGVEAVAKGAQSAELLHQAANGIDLFLDMFSFLGDAVQIEFARYLCHHHAQLLELTGVAEGELRRVVLALHHSGFLRHSGPCLFFCDRCPDGGLVGSLRGGIMNRRVRCPLCGRVAVCVSALHVADALQRSILQSDGFLTTATGWQLTERELPFCHSYRNKAGEEIDFLVEQPRGIMMIECKMHKLRGASLHDELAKDLDQLRDHLKVATRESIPVATAMCLVNLSAKTLNELIPIVAGGTSRAVKADELETLVHSYQNFPAAMDLYGSSAANHELVVRLAGL